MSEVWRLSAADAAAGLRAGPWTVGPDGTPAVLLVPSGDGRNGWNLCPVPPFDAVLVVLGSRGEQRRPVRGVGVRPDHLALLPGGRILLADCRSDEDEAAVHGAWPANAVVHGPDGSAVAAFCLGDDIRALVSDRAGRLWTAYGDEGVYGRHPDCRAGLAGWDARGRKVWSPAGRLPEQPLEGCAAATDGGSVLLAWYGEETHLTRVDPATGAVTDLLSPVPDPWGFAVRGGRAVLVAGRGPETSVVRAELHGRAWKVTGRSVLPLPGGPGPWPGHGRDGSLWVGSGDALFRLDA